MFDPASMAEKRSAMLGELAELGLSLARDLQRRALEAEAPAEAAHLADAFHRVARSVRQSLALEVRLGREARRDVAEHRGIVEREHRAAVARRKAVLTEALERLDWSECEADDGEDTTRYFGIYIEGEMGKAGFAEDAVEAQVRRICRDMELPEPRPEELAEICREAEAEIDANARVAAAHGQAPPAPAGFPAQAVPPLGQSPWRSSA